MRRLGWMASGEPAARPATAQALDGALTARGSRAASPSMRSWLGPVLAWNQERGASARLLDRARDALGGRGTAVVTGQQPALAGGPLYTLYKLLTAVELAAEVERRSGRPCQAIFWLVGDDSDFGEVAGTFWPRPDFSVSRIRNEEVPAAGTMIGRLRALERQSSLFMEPALWPGEGSGVRRERFEAILRRGGDWSGAVAATFFELWPELPILFVDGAHPAVIEAQSEWLAAAGSWPLADLLAAGAEEARALGHEPALATALGERAIYRVLGDRREPGGIPLQGALAPNVVLRPLVQDLLLPNVATVVGPSEIRYRAQLGPLYRHAELPPPALVPRLRAVLVPPPGDGAREASLSREDWLALRDPDRWLAALTVSETPAGLWSELQAWRERFARDAQELAPRLSEFDGSLPQRLESARGKIDFQFQRLEEGVTAKARQRLFRREPPLQRWREFVRPRDGEQERSLTLWTPFLFGGERPPEELREAARAHCAGGPEIEGSVAVFALESPVRTEES